MSSENKSKFDKYSELNKKYLSSLQDKDNPTVGAELSEPVLYLIRQAYMEGYNDCQSDLMKKMFKEDT